jgi:hypothetical protein
MIQRTRLARGLGVVLLAALVVTVVVAIWAWHWSTDLAVQLTAVAVVFAVGTFVLAVFAGVVAVLAYIASIQPPDLDVTLASVAWKDELVFVINPQTNPHESFLRLIDYQPELIIQMANRSPFSARNPACRVTMLGFSGIGFSRVTEGWSYVGTGEDVAQWDGGANYFIHGNWSRDFHLSPNQAVVWQADHAVVVEVVAEGFQKKWSFPVKILAPVDFERQYPEHRGLIPDNLRGWEGPAWLKKP